jgi:hypothetical protein
MDLWRISPDGGEPEQLTHVNNDIANPIPIDDRAVLFVGHTDNGAGPCLWAFDTETRTSHRVTLGLEQYTVLAATADGRRLAASVVNAQVNLWSVPLEGRVAEEKDVEAFPLPTVGHWRRASVADHYSTYLRGTGLTDCGIIARGKLWRFGKVRRARSNGRRQYQQTGTTSPLR